MAIDADEVLNGYLATENGHGRDRKRAAKQLGKLLSLPSVGLQIAGARIVGKGTRASADIYLSNGETITFDSLREIASPSRLASEIATHTGAVAKLTGAKTLEVLALLRSVAEHHMTADEDALSREWGIDFLQAAGEIPVDITDQADRWRVFSELAGLNPVSRSEFDHVAFAQACAVPVHTSGLRYVRRGWFRHYVRTVDATVSPHQLGNRMKRVGWQIPGSHGRIQARCPSRSESLVQTFYVVPEGWLEAFWEEAGEAW